MSPVQPRLPQDWEKSSRFCLHTDISLPIFQNIRPSKSIYCPIGVTAAMKRERVLSAESTVGVWHHTEQSSTLLVKARIPVLSWLPNGLWMMGTWLVIVGPSQASHSLPFSSPQSWELHPTGVWKTLPYLCFKLVRHLSGESATEHMHSADSTLQRLSRQRDLVQLPLIYSLESRVSGSTTLTLSPALALIGWVISNVGLQVLRWDLSPCEAGIESWRTGEETEDIYP